MSGESGRMLDVARLDHRGRRCLSGTCLFNMNMFLIQVYAMDNVNHFVHFHEPEKLWKALLELSQDLQLYRKRPFSLSLKNEDYSCSLWERPKVIPLVHIIQRNFQCFWIAMCGVCLHVDDSLQKAYRQTDAHSPEPIAHLTRNFLELPSRNLLALRHASAVLPPRHFLKFPNLIRLSKHFLSYTVYVASYPISQLLSFQLASCLLGSAAISKWNSTSDSFPDIFYITLPPSGNSKQ